MAAIDLTIPSLFNVKGKVAVVTGGGSGLGQMIATSLVQNGAKVYIASRKEAQLKEVSEALNKIRPDSCHYFVADLTTRAGCDTLTAAIKLRDPKVHILVNNSGMSWGAPYENVPEKEAWDRLMALNVKSVFYMTQGLTEALAKDATNTDPGRVINISSVAAIATKAVGMRTAGVGNGLWSYGTSKAAVNHLTTLLASTLAPRLITVNAIMPGIFPSKMTKFALKEHGEDGMASGTPMGRIGHPRDIAGTVLFLTSPAGALVTGAHLMLDGGGTISTASSSL